MNASGFQLHNNASLIRTGVDIKRLWNLSFMMAKNSTTSPPNNDTDGVLFFDTYFSEHRFAAESVFALLASLFNLSALFVVRRANQKTRSYSAYNTLFINLAIANLFACFLSWLTNNILFFFEKQMLDMMSTGTSICKVFLYLLAAVFVSCSFEVVSVLTMLGFTVVQYYAICRPLYHMTLIRKHSIHVFIGCSWAATLLLAMLPFVVLIIVASEQESCATVLLHYIIRTTVQGANISICAVALMYIVIIGICVRIYVEIRQLKDRLSQFRFASDVRSEQKAFITTVILLVSLTVFFLPYTVMFITTLNTEESEFIHKSAVIYYLNLLPYFKFMSDPVIYGLRMREVQALCLSVGQRCGCLRNQCCCCDVIEPPASPTLTLNMHPLSSFTF